MDNRQVDLCKYRIQESKDTLKVAENCLRDTFYKDAINRSYYSAFYAIKAVLALGVVDFKRHKDVIAYFNKEFVATGIFSREMGRKLATLKPVSYTHLDVYKRQLKRWSQEQRTVIELK